MRVLLLVTAAIVLAACEPQLPDSAAGVGFSEYSDYDAQRAARESALSGSVNTPSPTAISDEQVASGAPMPTAASRLPNVNTNNPGISDEQDFEAVSSRETIESDAERLAAQSQAYQVIEVAPLPTRSGSSGPSVVDFALSTTNQVGQAIYSRNSLNADARFNRNCAKYASSDMAQLDFLKSGGPEKDRKGLDPNGDGFACYWDPTPFRQAVRN